MHAPIGEPLSERPLGMVCPLLQAPKEGNVSLQALLTLQSSLVASLNLPHALDLFHPSLNPSFFLEPLGLLVPKLGFLIDLTLDLPSLPLPNPLLAVPCSCQPPISQNS